MNSRRQFLGRSVNLIAGLTILGSGIVSCVRKEPPLRIASNVFPGYEFLFLARERNYFASETVRMVELPSASVCIEALAAGTVEGACLTLDEVLSAREQGLELKVVTVLDISMGADMILAKPEIKTLRQLKGRKVGVEQSAVGAVMLHAALVKAGLTPGDIEIIHMNVNRHRDAYLNGDVDALVTFEPVISQLADKKTSKLFTSAAIPGRIVDVIAVRPEAIENSPEAIRRLVAGHFKALAEFRSQPAKASEVLAKRMKITPQEVPQTYSGIELPDAASNRGMMEGLNPGLESDARELAKIMVSAGLLKNMVETKGLVDGRFVQKI
ncbi:MAG: ABC transporter substrate-binding protein [Gammaproteobacteria bacterium]|nr:ABC transporter substrate-binding protein [Gammaproteobacteria bacterium]